MTLKSNPNDPQELHFYVRQNPTVIVGFAARNLKFWPTDVHEYNDHRLDLTIVEQAARSNLCDLNLRTNKFHLNFGMVKTNQML